MERILLDNGGLTGTVPEGLTKLRKLTQLYLEYNFLAGTFPSGIARLPKLLKLNIYHNQFTGPAPTRFANPGLQQLNLHTNFFTGKAGFMAGRKQFCIKKFDGGGLLCFVLLFYGSPEQRCQRCLSGRAGSTWHLCQSTDTQLF